MPHWCRQAHEKNDRIAWRKTPKGCTNSVDAYRIDRSTTVAIRGVFRNDIGKIDISFARYVGDAIVLVAECWASYEGIRIVRNSKIWNIEVESNMLFR